MNTQWKEFAFNYILNQFHRNTKQNFLKYKMLLKLRITKEAIKEGRKKASERREMNSLSYFQILCLTLVTFVLQVELCRCLVRAL